jgi:hypothetical protein
VLYIAVFSYVSVSGWYYGAADSFGALVEQCESAVVTTAAAAVHTSP